MSEVSKRWFFVIDTDSYSGNFERELGSYITGVGGEYFSKEFTEIFLKEEPTYENKFGDSVFSDLVGMHDSNGEHELEYVKIWITPGFINHGMGGEFSSDTDPAIIQADYDKECKKYHEQYEKHKGEFKPEKYHSFPSYQSVAICFIEKPTIKQIDLLKRRSEAFFKLEEYKKIKLIGFRLLEEKTILKKVKI